MSDEKPDSRFKPGNPGGPGRKVGSRNKLGEDFLADLHADWTKHGKKVIAAVRSEKPAVYLKVVASILPKELNIKVEPLDDLSEDELLARARQLARALGVDLGLGEDLAGAPAPAVTH